MRTNRGVRIACYPFARASRWVKHNAYLKGWDHEELKKMKGIHEGGRCFVIGNGPSLKAQDLERLKGETTFAANRIYNIFESTSWRPSYYTYIDPDSAEESFPLIKENIACTKFLSRKFEPFGREPEDRIYYIAYDSRYFIESETGGFKGVSLSEDVSDHVTRMRTVTANNIEIAIYLGFRKIYLLGVDHSYRFYLGADRKIHEDPSMATSYFQGMKDTKGNGGDGSIAIFNREGSERSYRLCKDYADVHGIRIYNATRGGKLEIFPRVDFDSIEGLPAGPHTDKPLEKERTCV